MIRLVPFAIRGNNAPQSNNVTAPAPEPESASADPNAKRVLVVDDDKIFVKAISTRLRADGFNVMTARDSSQAIAALSQNPIDSVMMDIEFPPDVANGGMGSWDGFQLMYWLRGLATAKSARYIIVSNSDSPQLRARAKQLGAVAYLQKPPCHEDLLEALHAEG